MREEIQYFYWVFIINFLKVSLLFRLVIFRIRVLCLCWFIEALNTLKYNCSIVSPTVPPQQYHRDIGIDKDLWQMRMGYWWFNKSHGGKKNVVLFSCNKLSIFLKKMKWKFALWSRMENKIWTPVSYLPWIHSKFMSQTQIAFKTVYNDRL